MTTGLPLRQSGGGRVRVGIGVLAEEMEEKQKAGQIWMSMR